MIKTISYIIITLFLIFSLSCSTESTPAYTITTTANPIEGGEIVPDSGTFDEGEAVSLQAIPAEGWVFVRWEQDLSSTANPLNITMNRDYIVVGVFERRMHAITIDVDGEGTVEERIISSPNKTDYPFETVVELTSKPSDGWIFYEWNGEIRGGSNPEAIKVDGEKDVTSVFKSIDELLTINIIGEGTADITQESFEENPSRRRVTITPHVQHGWKFIDWSGDVSSSDEVIEVIIDGEKNIILTLENENVEFYEDYAARDGVEMTNSGLLFRIIEDADGAQPTEESAVVIHFIGTFIDGEVYNNSYEQQTPTMTNVNELLAGLREGMQLMNTGATYEFVLPADLAYGNNPPQGIPPGATLIYEVELIHDNSIDPVFLEENALNEDVVVTESGLQYKVIEEGDGETPGPNSVVQIEYTGIFIYGDIFDTSRDSNDPAQFSVDGVISGFAEGLKLMQEGARYELYLPASIAYGDNPPRGIYPGATLIFDVELISVDQ